MNAPAAAATAPLAAIELFFSYGKATVLRGVSIQVQPGEIVGLIGPNGAGKSTLLHLLCGYLRPAMGSVVLGGHDAASLTRHDLARQVALVPQFADLSFGYRVLETVLMGRHAYGGLSVFDSREDLEQAYQALQEVDMTNLAERPVTELSGGEQRLVLIARALAQQSPTLLLDEPLAALDPKHQWQILTLLKSQAVQGRAILATFHDLTAAARWCNRLVLLHQGQVLAEGAASHVLQPNLLETAYQLPLISTVDDSGFIQVHLPV